MWQAKGLASGRSNSLKCSLLGEGGTTLFFRNSTPTFNTRAGENTVANKAAKWPNKATSGSESLKKYRKSWHLFHIAQSNFLQVPRMQSSSVKSQHQQSTMTSIQHSSFNQKHSQQHTVLGNAIGHGPGESSAKVYLSSNSTDVGQ
jgi:hypothetical protein